MDEGCGTTVPDVLTGRRRYDDLVSRDDKAAVCAKWTHRLDDARDGIDLTEHFKAEGTTSWVDVEPDGTVVHGEPRRVLGNRGEDALAVIRNLDLPDQ